MIEISRILVTAVALPIILIFAIIMIDWIFSGRVLLGEYMEYRNLSDNYPIYLSILTILAAAMVAVMLFMGLDFISPVVDSTVSFKFV